MNWEAIGSIAELLGAAGVIASLLYLANQVRQNTREMRSSTNQSFMSGFNGLTDFSTSSEYGAELFHRMSTGKMEDASAGEVAAYRLFTVKLLRLFEHAYLQHQAGLLADDVWQGWRTQIALSVAMPGLRQAWAPVKQLLSAEFVTYVESISDESIRAATAYSEAWTAIRPEWSPLSSNLGSHNAK